MKGDRRKVLHILVSLRFSGAEIMLNAAFKDLSEGGFEHHIIATGEDVGAYAETLQSTGYQVHHLPFRPSPSYFWRLFSFIRENEYSIIHIHMERASFWTALTAMAAGGRCVRTIHNTFRFPPRLRRVRGIQRRLMAKMGVAMVACSTTVGHNEAAEFGYSPAVISNGYCPDRVVFSDLAQRARSRSILSIKDDDIVIASIGNCSSLKNHSVIIESLLRFAPSRPPLYLHCGEGHADHGEGERASELGVQDRVRFLGRVPDIKDVLAASDVFISASSVEGGPIALLEAAAAGICCVTTRVGLAPELEGLPNVYLVPADPGAIAETVRAITDIPLHERVERGKALSTYVDGKYSMQINAQKYREIYEEKSAISSINLLATAS
ncbi:glycosyltransferase [Aquabacter sp. CN5-332]|uniref:glycosyltransferase n=1 Tax=Aquabacter sp. CN5-332 TaxID=3156608 RepID=UPI0032B54556